jgi:hypothetical protein
VGEFLEILVKLKRLLPFFLAGLTFLCARPAHAQYYSVPNPQVVVNSNGVLKAVPGAGIRFCTSPTMNTPCTPTATAYANPAGTIPFGGYADLNGNIIAYLAAGTYDIQISGPTIQTYTVYSVAIGVGGSSGGGIVPPAGDIGGTVGAPIVVGLNAVNLAGLTSGRLLRLRQTSTVCSVVLAALVLS